MLQDSEISSGEGEEDEDEEGRGKGGKRKKKGDPEERGKAKKGRTKKSEEVTAPPITLFKTPKVKFLPLNVADLMNRCYVAVLRCLASIVSVLPALCQTARGDICAYARIISPCSAEVRGKLFC